jgi:UDP-2-acetamido-2,6-beta-L-arabino-hexul-4-ose reductase
MRILVTGVDGFIGRNLAVRLGERGYRDVLGVERSTTAGELVRMAAEASYVFHLAGINRPRHEAEFLTGNVDFTRSLCAALAEAGRKAPMVFTSSIQVERDNPYGTSKRAAEKVLAAHGDATGAPVHIFRLPNVFGKWSRPDYNSAVATFCSQAARGLPLTVHDPTAPLRLAYIDDVVEAFLRLIERPGAAAGFHDVEPVYTTTVGEIADLIQSFAANRATLLSPRTGTGLVRALFATYLTFIEPGAFAYTLPRHGDRRGEFVEMLKTADSGQFSYFTAHPGITRGEHYHHTKAEKFLVVRGTARFAFRNIVTGATHALLARGGEGKVVETVPGWAHSITNVGADELIVMLWASEVFDRDKPDTFALKVES